MTISRFPARTFPRAYARFDRLLTLWDRLAELFHDRTNPRRSVRLGVEGLEDRVVPAGGWPDLNPVFFVGSGEGTGGTVKAYRSDTGDLVFAESVYDAAFLGGVHVAAGDVTGDGFPDLITAPSSGGGPRIQVLEGHTGKPIVGPLSSFWAFDSSFRGGVSVAAADMDADGIADVIAAAGPGGGPRVQVFSGATGMTIVDFFAFDADFRGGVSVAVADVDGDGTVDIIAGAGPGGGPRVRIFSGATGMTIADFFAFDADFRGGVTVAAGDLNGDRKAEVAVGVGRGGGPQVKVFNPLTATVIAGPLGCYFAFDPSDRTGVLLNADGLSRDLDGDGVSDLVVNTGAGIPARSRVFSGASGTAIANFDPSGNGDGVRAALIHMASGQTTGSSEATSEELQPEVNAEPAIPSDYGVNPMRFEANVGQTDSQVRFLARGDGYSLFLTSTEAVLSLGAANPPIAGNGTSKASVPGAVLRFQLLGAANAPQVVGVGRLPGVSNYLRGNDPAHWLTDVPNYAAVSYQEVYPGIDVIYHGNGERLEYDFTVAPGADPSVIRFRIQGTEGVALDAKGNLVLHTAFGDVLEHAPVLYQGEGANRQAVSGGYVLNEDGTVSFIVGSYDAARALVIDPVLAYSTYLGGSGAFTPGTNSDLFAKEYENAPAGSSFSLRSGATGKAIAVDGKGNAYVTGAVWTSAFPFTASVVQPKFTTSGNDAYVTMLDPAGRIVFSTYLGGNPDVTGASDVDVEFPDGVFKRRVGEQYASSTGTGIAVDDKGNVYVTGSTLKRADDGYSGKYIGFESPTLPLVNPFQSEYGGGPSDAFVAKLNPTGTALIYSSYYGGELLDEGTGIAADAAGNAYVVGTTISGNYTDNAFVLKINPVGAKVYEQVFGLDRTFTSGNAIAADAKGNVYFIGETTAAGLGTPLAEALGDHDVIVGRLNPAGKVLGLIRLGGNRNDFGTGIALDAHNNVYLTGTTISANFPTTAQAFQKDKPRLSFGVLSAFVTKLSSDLTRIIYSTYLGGTKGVNLVLGAGTAPRESPFGDAGYAIAVDSAGAAYVVGGTDAANFPSLNAAQKAHAPVPTNAVSGTVFAQNDAFVAKLDATGSNLVYSSYLGGSGQDVAFGVAVDNLGNAYVVGTTDSADLRTTVGAVQENFDPPALQYSFDPASFGHQTSAFVVRLAPPIRVFAHPIQAYLGEAFVGIPASFVSPDRDATPSDFSVSIDWGDGLEYLATVEIGDADSNLFLVRGFHVYFDRGAFPVVVTVHDLKHDTYATTADVVGAGGAYQGNATIVTDPSDPDRVFIAGSELVDAHTPALFLGTSDSRGLTWTTHVRPDDTVDLPAGGDSAPAAAADQYGNIFLAYLTNDPDHAAVVAVSTDGGATFSKLYTIPGESGTPVRPAIAVGPGINGLGASVWVAAQVGDNITVVGAPVGGLGDVGDFVLRPGVAPEPDAAAPLLGDIAIGPDGNVAVSYHVQGSAGPSAIYVLTLPGSLTPANEDHETAKAADTQLGIAVSIPAQSERAFPAGARLAWDTSTGPHRGRLYLVYTDAAAPDDVDTDIILRVSDDRGRTWGERSRLNDDNGAASQFLPSIAVDPSNGDVAVGWYDARYDPNGENLQVLYAITVLGSGDADIPSKNVTASVYFSDANRTDPNPVSPILQFGDISGIAFSGGIIHAVWADNSAGLRGATGTQNDFSIAAAAIPVAHVTVPPPVVTGVPWTFTEGTLLTGTVATFTEADPFLNSDSFSATIDWGDGSPPTTGVVFLAADGEKFNVNGTHLYTSPGAYVLTVTVVDTANGLLTSTLSNVSRASGYQADGSVAVDPTNADRLFAVSVDRTTVTGSYSSDGGLTWNRVPIGEEVGGTPELLTAPRAVFDRYGNLFVAFLRPGSSEASVLLSTDGGQSFQPAGTFLGADLLGSVGLAVGPGRNADEEIIWITYRVGEHDIAAAGAAVVGPGVVGPFGLVQTVPGLGGFPSLILSDVAVGPEGRLVVVFQTPETGPGPSRLFASVDADGLGSGGFGTPTLITDTNVGGATELAATFVHPVGAEAHLAWDLTDGPRAGRLYLAYTDAPSAGSIDTVVVTRYSDDGGLTWSDPVRVGDDAAQHSQFLPSIALDPASGNVAVSWYDTRNDPAGVKAELFAAVTANGGVTFSRNAAVSLGASDPYDPGLDPEDTFGQFGSHTGLAFRDGTIYPVWADNTVLLSHNPDLPQFDLAIGRMPIVYVTDVPLTATALDISADVGAEGEGFTADLASFTDADPNANLALYSATIDWGDGTDPEPGEIREEGGTFTISGGHGYQEEGSFTITVTIDDVGGASTTVTIDTDIEDADLVAVESTFRPAEGVAFTGVVATFTDGNPNAKPQGAFGDYDIPTINWGDGTAGTGTIVYDGSAALTAWSFHSGFLAIGTSSDGDHALIALDALTSTVTTVMPLGPEFFGGLAEGPNYDIFALSTNGAGQSFLNLLNVDAQTARPVAYLGSGFTGGLAFDSGDGKFYAIGNGSTLYAIDATTWAVQAVGSIETHTYAGLTYAGGQTLFAVGADEDGKSKLYRIHLGAAGIEFAALDINLGSGFTGGLAATVHFVGEPNPFGLFGNLAALSGRGDGSSFLNAISRTDGTVTPAYEIPGFNGGFAIVGTHTYGVEGTQTVTVEIRDVGGSAAIATSTAVVVDEPPIALAAPPPVSVFQGFASGPLTVGSFSVPHGAETGPNEYTAAIDWGDGSAPDAGLVTVSGSTITVSSAGHTYTQMGTSQPGAKTGEYRPVVTLTDDTGNAASVTDTVHVAPDVSNRVRVVGLGGPLNPSTGLIASTGTITNLDGVMIPGPLYLIVQGLPAGVTLANAEGTMFSGEPYYVANVSQLNPGQTFSNVTLQFSDPGLTPFTYSVTVIDGPVGRAAPAGTIAVSGSGANGFVANAGQTDAQVRFASKGDGYTLFLTATGAVLSLLQPVDTGEHGPSAVALGLEFVGADPAVNPVGLDPLSGSTNYLFGNNPSGWHANVTSFGRIEYRDIYPGITLDYHGTSSQRLEYDFTVSAGADPGLIRLDFRGSDSIAIDAAGNLVLHTAAGDVVEQAPVMYQVVGGMRRAVAGAYTIGADGRVGFRVGAYDHGSTLVIDPVLVYSTYLGGSALDVAKSVATDAAGNAYITGYTYSPEFPTLGALGAAPDRLGQPYPSGGQVAFVTKLDPTGAVVYSTYLGGSGLLVSQFGFVVNEGDSANGIAVDASGAAYITGSTYSRDFPVMNALAPKADEPRPVTSFLDAAGAFGNGFVAKLSADGSRLLFSTYLTGTQQGSGIALDPNGNAYVVGIPASNFSATAGAVQSQGPGGFVEKLSSAGDRVLYATFVPGTEPRDIYLGGYLYSVDGEAKAIAVNAAGEAYVTGNTSRRDGPILNAAQTVFGGGIQNPNSGSTDAFVAKFNATGSGLVYWTYLGGSDYDYGDAIAVDGAGNAYVTGTTRSGDFPTAQAMQTSLGGAAGDRLAIDAFVTKVSPDGSSFLYSTYLGGSGPDTGAGIAVDAAGNAYVTGQAGSSDFPIRQALQPTFRGDGFPQTQPFDNYYSSSGRGDAFVTRLNASGTALDYSTFLGGSGFDRGNAIAVSLAGDAIVTGATTSVDFPTLNALQGQAGLLSGTTTVTTPDTGIPYIVPASTIGRTRLEIPTAFATRIAAQGPGVLRAMNVPFQPVEGIAFSGVVASFTDTDTDTAADYTATIDWGDGTTSAGAVTSDNANGFGFVVNGTHTYAEVGAYAVTVSVRDDDGSTAAALETTFGRSAGGPITYRIGVDTSALAGTTGFLDFQFNPGALPQTQSARATIASFQTSGGSIGGTASFGNASGNLGSSAILLNSAILNELKQGFTFGDSLSFEVRLDGDALAIPARGLFGSTFSLLLLGADGRTPLQTAGVDGAVLRIALSPDGSTRLVPTSGSRVSAAAVNAVTVADAPLAAALVPIQAVEGLPFRGTVATFTDANPAGDAAEFTAQILWGDGSAATEGTIVADGNAHFHVTGEHTYTEAGSFAIRVVVRDRHGSSAQAVGTPAAQTSILGLQAPRVAFAGSNTDGLPVSFATGDLNGDGKPDLAVWHSQASWPQSRMLDVLLGNGDGSFQDPVTVATLSTNSTLQPIALADFDADGKLDIATNGMVYLGNGDGTFQAGKPYEGGTGNFALVVADFNGDRKPDLAVVYPFSVNFLFGNGDGTFEPSTSYTDPDIVYGGAVVFGDFNGDGKPDMVFSPYDSRGAAFTHFVPNNGDGTFGAPLPVTNGFAVAATADLNGDGKLDLVGTGGNRLLVLLGKGDGTFLNPTIYAAGEQPTLVVVGDFDRDGIPDLAVDDSGRIAAIGAGVSLLKGTGDGTFAPAVLFPTAGFWAGRGGIGTGDFAAADFNGDGSLDVMLRTPTTISMLFGRGDGTLVDGAFGPTGQVAAHFAAGDFDGDGRGDVAITDRAGSLGTNVLLGNRNGTFQTASPYPLATFGPVLLSGDFNGDGQPDLITANQLLLGRGDGTYLPAVELNFGGAQPFARADFNRDGKLDLVLNEFHYNGFTPVDTVSVLLGNGDGTFRQGGNYVADEGIASIAVADMNGDGVTDIVLGRDFSVVVVPVNADGSLQSPLIYAIANQFSFGVVVGDFNGDGRTDVAASSKGVNIFLGNGDGSLQAPVNYDSGFNANGVAVGDFNGDGKLDLITRQFTDVRILLGNGDGTFAAGVTVSTGEAGGFQVITGDFNGDARLDFAVGGRGYILVVPGNGDGTFRPGLAYASAVNDAAFARLTTDDVNHDGRADIVAVDVSAIISVFLAKPGGELKAARDYLTRSRSVLVVDLNGDGRPDLVGSVATFTAFNNNADKVYVRLNGGGGTFPQFADYDVRLASEQNQTAFIQSLVVGDFNGDGIIDLVADVQEPFVGLRRAVLLGNGDGTFRAPQITDTSSSGSNVEKLLARDVNGDGKLDLIALAANFNGAYLQVNLGNGDGTFQNPIRTGPLANVTLQGFGSSLAAQGFAVADFTGDGKLDAAVGDTDRSIGVLPGNGDGTFGAPIASAVNLWTTAFAAGDLNGDGKIDLVTANVNDTASLLLGKGDGTFQKPLTYLSDHLTDDGSSIGNDSIALADLNADGVPDVIVGAAIHVVAIVNRPPAASSQNVADAPLTAVGVGHPATAGVPLFGIVARFTDANPLGTVADFGAAITWGDGHTSAGTIQPDLNGGFIVLATNTYAQAGTFTATITITDEDGSTATVNGTMIVEAGPDAALAAVGLSIDATARVPFTEVVATFTDSDPTGRADDFTAVITWGDGRTSPGFVRAGTAGYFEVVGVHTFADAGSYPIGITIRDTAGASASATGNAEVAANTDLPLTPSPVTFTATEQTTFTSIIATFTDADPEGQEADFAATIDWGDGVVSAGTITADATTAGQFKVIGAHGYVQPGTYTVVVQIADRGGATASVTSRAIVADAALTGTGRLLAAQEGAPFSGIVASFTDANPFSTAADFTASITWGDGRTSTGTVSVDGPGRFTVGGTNLYAEAGVFAMTVAIAERGGAVTTVRSAADVSDAPLSAAGLDLAADPRVAFTATVATFTDANPASTPDDFTAMVQWGDGRTTPGSVTANPAGGFRVSGSHVYAVAGSYAVHTSILDRGGALAMATGMVEVARPLVEVSAEAVRATEGTLFTGMIASFTLVNPGHGVSGFVAAIDWGDGRPSIGHIVADLSSGSFHVFANHTYVEEGAYEVTIAIGDRSGVLAASSTMALVSDAPLTAEAVTVRAIQGTTFTGVVATFTDANPVAVIGDYTASFVWNNQISNGTIVADPDSPGRFDVIGTITPTDLGTFPVAVNVVDRGGASATITTTVVVGVLPTAAGTSFEASAGVSFVTTVATITDANPGDRPADFTATIDWGDGHNSRGLVTLDASNPGQFLVLGSTTYAQQGAYPVSVELIRSDGYRLTAVSAAEVAAAPDAPLRGLPGFVHQGRQNASLSAIVASFQDADTTAASSDFVATIYWGDGASSPGIVIANPAGSGQFFVGGTHVYADAGTYFVRVAIQDGTGAAASTTAFARIAAVPPVPGLPPGRGQIYAVGAGPGGGPRVQVYDAITGTKRLDFFAYDDRLRGGVSVATGDVNGDGVEDVITGAGEGGGAHVKVFDGATGEMLASWFAYDPAFRSGVWVAAGDLDGEGKAEVVTGPGAGGGPVVEVWQVSHGTAALARSFMAYEDSFRGGVTVACGVGADGRPTITVGAGAGGGPRVRTFDAATLAVLSEVFAFEPDFAGGVYVAAGDVLGTGHGTQVVVGPGPGGGPRFRVFGTDGADLGNGFAALDTFRNGLTVAALDRPARRAAVLVGAGVGAFQGELAGGELTSLERVGFFGDGFDGGVFVG